MNIFANFISLLNVIVSLVKVIVSWPMAVVVIVFILRKDISRMIEKMDFQGITKNIFKDKKEK